MPRPAERVATFLDRTDPARHDALHPLTRSAALAFVAVLFFAGWGEGTFNALRYLATGDLPSPSPTWADAVGALVSRVAQAVLLTVAAVAVVRLLAGSWYPLGAGGSSSRLRRELFAGCAGVALAVVGFLLGSAIRTVTGPEDGGYPVEYAYPWLSLRTGLAGPTEELAVLIAPLVILRAARISWPATVLILVTLRWVFHIYYGWPSLGLLVWAAGVIGVYLLTRGAIGLAVGHSVLNLSLVPHEYGISEPYLRLAVIVATFSVLVYAIVRGWHLDFWRDRHTPDPYALRSLAGIPAFLIGGTGLVLALAGVIAAIEGRSFPGLVPITVISAVIGISSSWIAHRLMRGWTHRTPAAPDGSTAAGGNDRSTLVSSRTVGD